MTRRKKFFFPMKDRGILGAGEIAERGRSLRKIHQQGAPQSWKMLFVEIVVLEKGDLTWLDPDDIPPEVC
jgi:hypothetical protein